MHQFALKKGVSIRPAGERKDLFKAYQDFNKPDNVGVINPDIVAGSLLASAFSSEIVSPRQGYPDDLTVFRLKFNKNWIVNLFLPGVDLSTPIGVERLAIIDEFAQESLFRSMTNLGYVLNTFQGNAVTRYSYNEYRPKMELQR